MNARRFTAVLQTPKFLDQGSVLRIHDRQLQKFGGTPDIRDRGLLESALAQPEASFGDELLHPTIHEQAAAYVSSIHEPSFSGRQ